MNQTPNRTDAARGALHGVAGNLAQTIKESKLDRWTPEIMNLMVAYELVGQAISKIDASAMAANLR